MIGRRDPLANPEPLIRRVYSYAAYRVGPGPEAEDITSETFEHALRSKHTYDASKGTPVAWVLGIARNCVADAVAARLPTVAEPPELGDDGRLEEEAVERITLAAAIASLDEREQDLIALRYGADLTAKRIGEALGLSTNAVEVALHRALGHLRSRLDGEFLPSPGQSGSEIVAIDL
jgi:RNA polymerase sigma factor (sigma-70 family)